MRVAFFCKHVRAAPPLSGLYRLFDGPPVLPAVTLKSLIQYSSFLMCFVLVVHKVNILSMLLIEFASY